MHACEVFLEYSVAKRRTVVKEKGLCYACLGQGHMTRVCRNRMQCDICNRKHPTLLHYDMKSSKSANSVSNAMSITESVEGESRVFHSIIPVMMKQKVFERAILTYCFLDNGSNGCFVTQELFEQLKLTGRESWLQMNTMHGALPMSRMSWFTI